MNLPTTEQIPDDPDNLPPARRRRARRLMAPLNADERSELVDVLGHRASPSFDFFFFSFIAGIILAAGLIYDEFALLVLGASLAPLMAPVVGIALGTVMGSIPYFTRSLIGFLFGGLMVAFAGWASGYAALNWFFVDINSIQISAQLSWVGLLVLFVSSILTTASLAQTDSNESLPYTSLPSVALAYSLYLPLVMAGFGFATGLPHLWPDGLVVFSVYMAWAALLGALTLAIKGFRPLTIFGYTLGGAIVLVGIILMIGLSGAGTAFGAKIGIPTPIPTKTHTPTPSPTLTNTPIPPTPTHTPTLTPTISPSPTSTYTPTATPLYALLNINSLEGARLREEPGGKTIGYFNEDTLLILLPEIEEADGKKWIHVRTLNGVPGWVIQELLVEITLTPQPDS